MKKFLTILAVAGVMTACNNGTDETKGTDSPKAETPAPATPKVDTVKGANGADSLYITTSAEGKMDTVKATPAPAAK